MHFFASNRTVYYPNKEQICDELISEDSEIVHYQIDLLVSNSRGGSEVADLRDYTALAKLTEV